MARRSTELVTPVPLDETRKPGGDRRRISIMPYHLMRRIDLNALVH
ncbi:hypothetical protein [Mycetohabitans sp. B46]